jgi:hypothetical protein
VGSLVFLLAFLLLSLIGALLLWLRDRGPRSMEAHIREFERELHALSPEAPLDPPRRRGAPRGRLPRGHDAG